MARPLEELTEEALVRALGPPPRTKTIAVGSEEGRLTAARILGTQRGVDMDALTLGPDEWEVRG